MADAWCVEALSSFFLSRSSLPPHCPHRAPVGFSLGCSGPYVCSSVPCSLWGQVDHCPAWDGAWLTLLCRARKHASPAFDWTPYVADIYSFARASIHTPVSMGDAGSAPLMRGRPVAYQYQSFGPSASRSPGVKLNKLSKLMVFLLGKGGPAERVRVSDVAIVPPAGQDIGAAYDAGDYARQRTVSPGALKLLSLFRSLRTYFHPSNGGRWSLEMGLMVNYVLRGLAKRVGAERVLREDGQPSPVTGELARDDAGLVVDALLPLVLEMVYSKDPSVGSLSNMCLSALASLSPKSVAPAFSELILRALDPVASINHTHQASPLSLESVSYRSIPLPCTPGISFLREFFRNRVKFFSASYSQRFITRVFPSPPHLCAPWFSLVLSPLSRFLPGPRSHPRVDLCVPAAHAPSAVSGAVLAGVAGADASRSRLE